MTRNKNVLAPYVLLILCIALFYISCKKDEIKLEAAEIELISGADQSQFIGEPLVNPIEIMVKDQNGNAFKGTTINFAVSEGSVSFETATTDASGKASVIWTLGQTPGTQILTINAFKADGKTALKGSPIAVSSTANQKIPTEGLVAYYPFNGNANDESGNGYNGTIYGAAIGIDRFGNENSCYNFDGTNDYVDMGNILNNIQLPITISTWVYWHGATSSGEFGIISSDNSPTYYYQGFRIAVIQGGIITFRIGDGGIAAAYSRRDAKSPAGAILENEWTHLVVIAKGLTDVAMYLNGISVSVTYAGTGGNMVHTGNPLVLGRWTYNLSSGEDWFFDGIIDEMRLYNRALTEEEISIIFSENGWSK